MTREGRRRRRRALLLLLLLWLRLLEAVSNHDVARAVAARARRGQHDETPAPALCLIDAKAVRGGRREEGGAR